MDARQAYRRLAMGLATLLGRPRGFFIPYRYAEGVRDRGHPAIEPRFQAAEGAFREVLRAVERVGPELLAFAQEAPAPAPRFTQDWFPTLDAAAAYAIVRDRRPARIVEVGSGHSTRFLAAALAANRGGGTLVAIDPAPRALIRGLPGVELVQQTVQGAGPAVFQSLGAGDVLFIDSSHVLMPGTDVDLLLGQALPALPAGVLVHVHDIFLPDGYPAAWAWRGYNEAQGIAALLAGGAFRLVFASHYVQTRMGQALADGVIARLPRAPGAHAGSLWLEKGAGEPGRGGL